MKSKTAAIIGAGPAGCICAYFAQKSCDVTIFEANNPLHTILYTGGGRCNLAFAEYDFKELAKSYPRGEKFLYSVFSQFSTADTIDFFKTIGVETYTQKDLRIFPKSDSAKDVRERLLQAVKNSKIKKEKITSIKKDINGFLINDKYKFDNVVIAVGGHAGFSLAKSLGHNIISPKPSLVGLCTKENFKDLQGLTLKHVLAKTDLTTLYDDLLFTHFGVSGPLAYKISSIYAREEYNPQRPINISLNLIEKIAVQEFQTMLEKNSKKDIKNFLCEFIPKSFAEYVLNLNKISVDTKCHEINKLTRDLIYKTLSNFEINVISAEKEGEIVTSGGVDLKEINSKDMQSKLVEGLYFCGETIDVDGFCGGFNLQNCWSTGFIAGNHIKEAAD